MAQLPESPPQTDDALARTGTRIRPLIELLAILLTGVGKFICMDWLELRLPYIIATVLFWSAWVAVRVIREKGILREWGFRRDTFWKSLRLLLPFVMGAVALCLLVGAVRGTIQVTWHILPLLVLYPLWGTVQQFLMIGLVAGNLEELGGGRMPTWAMVLVTALLFSAVHFPSALLMLATFLLALAYAWAHLRVRNLWVLGILHGWLGALFYYTVLGRDSFAEVFGRWL